jgi:tetratricopeptide (TPR) repeat protein
MQNYELNEWICAIRLVNKWIFDDKENRHYRPWIMFLLQIASGLVIDVQIFDEEPFPHEVFNQIIASSKKPTHNNMVFDKPDVISFGDQELLKDMKDMLLLYGIEAIYRNYDALIEPIIEECTKGLNADFASIPGLLSVPKVTRKMAACFFEQAQFFYQSKPWEIIDDTYLLEVLLPQQAEPYYVYVLGAGEIETGLAVFTSWEKYVDFYLHTENADWHPEGYHLFNFDYGPAISFEDIDNAAQFNWPLPEPGIYPSPLYFTESKMKRPDFKMILWYQAALRAIPLYLDQFVNVSGQVKLRGEEVNTFTVKTSEGSQDVRINFCTRELPEILTLALESAFDEDEPLPFFDRRGMEGDLRKISFDYFDDKENWTPVRKAQELMYDAWDTPQREERIKLARKALKISPDCADAYVLLAEEEADTLEKSRRLYQEGVEAGKRALGEAFLNDPENIGYFWGILDTRPFMRALHGYGICLAQNGGDDLALDCFRELLRLNPNDNQGVRFSLLEFLITRLRTSEARELIEEYGHSGNVDFAYSELLLAFEDEEGATEKELRLLLDEAIDTNAFVPDFLTEKKPISEIDSYSMVVGGIDEAANYALRYLDSWKAFRGALDWLKKNAA